MKVTFHQIKIVLQNLQNRTKKCFLNFKSIDLQFFEQGRNGVRPFSPSWMASAKVHPMAIPMDYQPLFCDQMGPRGGPKSVPGSKWVPSWPETNPILSPQKLLQSKKVVNSYQLVLDGPSICKQKNFRFPPPGGAVAKSWKSHFGPKRHFPPIFFNFFFAWILSQGIVLNI